LAEKEFSAELNKGGKKKKKTKTKQQQKKKKSSINQLAS